jgi:hypothetical protein
MPRQIVLLTDFGHLDPYVGQMKGVLLSHAPEARIVDLCHQVKPFNILQAGFFLAASHAHFPEGTVFVAVVDPGVGGDRRIVLLEKHHQFFLAPDNGLLTFLLQRGGPFLFRDVTPPWRREASATFHGRDLFAPLAARLANDTPSWQLGEEGNPHSLIRLPGAEPSPTPEGLASTVLHVDRFGNCLLNLETEAWGTQVFKSKNLALMVPADLATRSLHPVFTYERLEPGHVGIIRGSQGFLELAMNQQSAATELDLSPGDAVSIRLDRR